MLAAVVMPQFRQTFQAFGAELPWLTKVLLDHPASLLVFPAVILLVAFLWPNKTQRGLYSLLLGLLIGIAAPVLVVIGGYLPIRALGAAI